MFIYIQFIIAIASTYIYEYDVTPMYQNLVQKKISFLCESGRLILDNGYYTYQIFLKENYTNYNGFQEFDQLWVILNNNGCSSIFQAYDKYGPFTFKNGVLDLHPYSYNKFVSLLYIDQPYGVGLSEGKGDQGNVNNILKFLKEFIGNKGIFKTKIMLYGKEFVASLFSKIIENSQDELNIEGIILDNAWVSPIHQIGYYGSFLYQLGLINDQKRDEIQYDTTQIQVQLLNQNFTNITRLKELVNQSLSELNQIEQNTTNNQEHIVHFLNEHSFQLYGVQNKEEFKYCNEILHDKAQELILNSAINEIESLLNKQKKVVILAKQISFKITTPGIAVWITQLRWQHIMKWRMKEKVFIKEQNLNSENNNTKTVGYIKQFDKLHYIVAYDEQFKLLQQIIIDN